MTGLGIDTSSDILSTTLLRDEEIYSVELDAGLRHSERLMEAIDAVFALARAEAASLDFVSCMRGPGSFTGLRIGMSTAKGLATALGVPLFAVPTLDCMASSRAAWPDVVLPLIDAKKNRWYAAAFRSGTRLCPDSDASAEELVVVLRAAGAANVLVCGSDAPRAVSVLGPLMGEARFIVDTNYRSGASVELVRAASNRFRSGDSGEADGVGLEYLRKSEAELTREAKAAENRVSPTRT